MISISLKKELSAGGFFKVKHLKTVGSTNDFLKALPQNKAREGFVVVADEQTNGRGRLGRTFFSKKGGLYFSILLKPSEEVRDFLTVIAAIAVCDAVRNYANDVGVKWVNDVQILGKKCCGILAESTENLKNCAIVGIGVNLGNTDFDESIKDIATSVNADRWELLGEILANFKALYQNFDKVKIAEEYKARCSVIGSKVKVVQNDGEEYFATAETLDEDCRLVVRCEDGTQKVLSSGEVKIIV